MWHLLSLGHIWAAIVVQCVCDTGPGEEVAVTRATARMRHFDPIIGDTAYDCHPSLSDVPGDFQVPVLTTS